MLGTSPTSTLTEYSFSLAIYPKGTFVKVALYLPGLILVKVIPLPLKSAS